VLSPVFFLEPTDRQVSKHAAYVGIQVGAAHALLTASSKDVLKSNRTSIPILGTR